MNALGSGIYTITEAAGLVGVSAPRARAWFKGWSTGSPGLFGKTDFASDGCPDYVSFLDLVDVLVVSQLRLVGVSMPAVRQAYRIIGKRLGSRHPFGREELMADSKGKLFIYAAEQSGDKTLSELVSGQEAFPQILLRYLKKIRYDSRTRFAQEISLGRNVIINANRKYGKPIVASVSMPTAILAAGYRAMHKDAETVADWYNVPTAAVLDAVAFESGFSGIAA